MNIALLGPSGAGKGTHGHELCVRFDLDLIATGELLRENLKKATPLGQLAHRYMEAGELVPDEIADGILEEALHSHPVTDSVLFDGFPRRKEQAEFLDALLRRDGRTLDAVIYLRVPEHVIVHRLTGRLLCEKCHEPYHKTDRPPMKAGVCDECGGEVKRRTDECAELALKRYRVFERHVGPALEYYQRQGKLHIVDASRPIPVVRDELILLLDSINVGAATPVTKKELRDALPSRIHKRRPITESVNLVLLGAPGSGKGTQAERLASEFALRHIATGDLFRYNLKNNTRLGQLARTYMNRGELVPDDITEAMVEERLENQDTANGFILDGFPRTGPQAAALTEMLKHLHRSLAGVVYIRVPDDAIVERLSGRFVCKDCQTPYHVKFHPPQRAGICDKCGGALYQREDDKAETVRARLKTFHKQTEALVDHFRNDGLLIEIDGQGDIDAVTHAAFAAVRGLRPGGNEWEEETAGELALT